MPGLLLTRPQDDSDAVAKILRHAGWQVVIAPLLTIVPTDHPPVDATGAQGILVTSANGIRALAQQMSNRTLPVWAVGDASARISRELGFSDVHSAGGDVDSLANLVRRHCHPAAGHFLHGAGSVTAGDLAADLAADGFRVRRLVLYQAQAAESLPDDFAQSLHAANVKAALFYSPRTAATFAKLIRHSALGDVLTGILAYCLSPAVAAALGDLPWAGVRIAQEPTQAALLAELEERQGHHEPH